MPSRLDVELEILELEYLTRPVRTMILKDAGTLEVDSQRIELQKGVEVELPYWLAKQLALMGLAKIIETPITLEDIAKLHFSVVSAKTPSDLEPLPQHFYQEAKMAIRELEEQARRQLNPMLFEESQKLLQYLIDIIDKRLSIILQSLRSPTSIAELSSRLAPEEIALLNVLSSELKIWRERMIPKRKEMEEA